MATRIGTALVGLEADASLFRSSAYAGIKKALAGVEGKIPVRADTEQARLQIDALKRRMTDLNKGLAEIKIGADGKPAESVIRRLQLELKELADTVANVTMDADTSKIDAKIARETLRLRKWQQAASALKLDANDKALIAKIANLELRRQRFQDRLTSIDIVADPVSYRAFTKAIASITADIAVLDAQAQRIVMRADAKAFKKEIIESKALIKSLKADAADMKIGGKIDLSALAAAEGRLVGLEDTFRKLNPEVDVLQTKLIQGARAFGRFGLGALAAKVALFGGLRFVSGWHIALDAVIEGLAVIVPALLTAAAGLAAFGLAGVDAARAVYNHLLNVHTVADAMNKTIPPMTGNLEKLHAVVRPQVWQLYGDAIAIAHSNTGLFSRLAVQTGGVIDTFAAKITVLATTGGAGLSNFLKIGARDLQQFGRIARSLGDAVGKLIQVTQQTRIAEILLNIVGAAAKMFDVFTKIPIPLLAAVIGLHGLYLWSGLAASAMTGLLRPFGRLAAAAAGAKLAGTAVEDLAKAGGGTRFARLGASFRDLGTNLKAIPGRAWGAAKAVGTFLVSPWGLLAIGVVALGVLVYALSKTKSATDRAIDSINSMVTHATDLNIINITGAQLLRTNQGLVAAQGHLSAALRRTAAESKIYGGTLAAQNAGLNQANESVRAYTAEHQKLVKQLTTVTGRLAGVANAFGTKGLTGAMALAHLAGVSVNELLSDKKGVWAAAIQKIAGVVQGYANMGQGSTQLANDINVLTIAQSDQLKNVESLNTAFDNFTKIVSGPISGFLQFANTLKRFGNDAGKAGAQMSGLGSGMTGVSKKVTDASLQLQTDFQDTFSAATQMADAMRLTGTASDKQVGAIKDVVKVMIPMAGSNKAAAAEISALAQEAGGPATTNLKTLGKWAGNIKDPLGKAQKAADAAAISFFNMSEDAQKLGTTLSQDLTKDMAAAVENAVGLQGAMNTFAKDIQNGTDVTAKGHKDRQALINDLADVGITGKPANAILKAMSDRLTAHRNALAAGAKARALFNTDLNAVLTRAPNAKTDVQNLADAIKNHGVKSDAAKAARKKLIDDLKKSGVESGTAKGLVDNLQTSISGMHGKTVTVGVNFVGSGHGSIAFKESIPGVTVGPSSSGILGFRAAGGQIQGGIPGKDSVLSMLMPGEVVVPTRMVQQGAVDHLRGKLPGFAAGGQVGVRNVVGTGNRMLTSGSKFMQKAEGHFGRAVEAAFAKAVIKKFNQDMNALAGNGSSIVRFARSFLGKIPYRFGGTSFSGDDCSGFTQAVYGHFGIRAPRTSEAQFSWATKSRPVPGGLAFYVSKAGGPPPGHVAIVQNGSSVISQGGPQGVKGPRVEKLNFLPLMGTGVPKGGFPSAGLGGAGNPGFAGPANLSAGSAQSYAASQLGRFGWGQAQMKFLSQLWTRESNWNRLARNHSSGAYGIPQALPPSKMGAAANPPTSSAAAQINWGLGYIRGRYGSPQAAWAHELSFGWYGRGGMVPGYATGGTVAQRGQQYLTAWRTRRGGPYALAIGPKVINEQIPEMQAAYGRANTLAHAGGLSAGQHRFWAKAAASDKRLLNTLLKERTTEQAWRGQLGATDKTLAREIKAAGNLPSLRKNVTQWKAQTKAHESTISQISKMLGFSNAYIAAHPPQPGKPPVPPGPVIPGVTHVFGGDVGETISAYLSSIMAPFKRGGLVMDRGGWLAPGWNPPMYNGTGRPERVGGDGSVHVHFDVRPSGNAFDQFLIAWLKRNVKVKGGGDVQKAWGTH